jgi:hypothetical protein
MPPKAPRPPIRENRIDGAGSEFLGGHSIPKTIKTRSREQDIEKLDCALLRLFPNIPNDVRKALRRPLAQWRKAAAEFLASKQDQRADLEFSKVWLEIAAQGPRCQEVDRQTLIGGLLKEIDAAVGPQTCPYRWTCALKTVLEKLFGADSGAV